GGGGGESSIVSQRNTGVTQRGLWLARQIRVEVRLAPVGAVDGQANPGADIATACLDQRDGDIGVFAQPGCQDAAGGPCSNDDIIEIDFHLVSQVPPIPRGSSQRVTER